MARARSVDEVHAALPGRGWPSGGLVMTCRDEVLAAFAALAKRTDRVDFSPTDVLEQMRSSGGTYKDSTVRTHVTAHMLADGSLLRSSPGRYRLARHRDRPIDRSDPPPDTATERMSEDFVKRAVVDWLESDGWEVQVRWGRERGIDIDAHRGDERWVIGAKGEAPRGPQQVNYFLGALGELTQRIDDSAARYGIALPDHSQYR